MQGRIPELDGLRGTAIFLVLVFHYLTQQGSVASPLVTVLQRLVVMGWSGVDLFFVLSGFLIGGILLEVRGSPSYFKVFYVRRFFRIVPIYYLWVLGYILLIAIAGPAIRARANSGILIKPNLTIYGHFLFLQNMTVVSFGGLAGAWFSHLWSLAVEEQFYLVSPLLVKFLSPGRLAAFMGSVMAGAPLLRVFLLRFVHTDPGLVAVLMPCRADSLAVGVLAAVFWRRDDFRQWLSAHGSALYGVLAVLLAGVGVLWKWSPQGRTFGMESIGFTWIAFCFVVVLLLALTRPSGPIARIARLSWLRELGRVSYCVYIIHLVVNVVCHSILRKASPGTVDLRGATVTVLAAFASFGIAWISWQILEGPLVRHGHANKYETHVGPTLAT